MELRFDKERTVRELSSVSFRGGVVFGVGCVERMASVYVDFFRREKWGDEVALWMAIDAAWEVGMGASVSLPALERILAACEAGVPHSDEFGSPLAQYAQNAMLSTCSLLDYMMCCGVGRLAFVPQYAVDVVDFYVQESEEMDGGDLELRILEHPLMQQELVRQRRDLAAVLNAKSLDRGWLQDMRVAGRPESVFILGVPPVL